mgnify:CR=1 FL=1
MRREYAKETLFMFGVFAFDAVHAGFFEIDIAFKEAVKLTDTGGVTHFAECLGLDLADALAGDLKLATDLFSRPRLAAG